MDENTGTVYPAVIRETDDTSAHDAADREDEGHVQSDPDALARLSDPSLDGRRDRIAARVKDRSGLQWVPAGELLRRGTQHAGDAVARGQEHLHRTVRDRTVAGVGRAASVAAKRVALLGKPRPTPDAGRDASTVHKHPREALCPASGGIAC